MQLEMLLVIFVFAFTPSIIYMIWIRHSEKYAKDPWRYILKAFFTGATLGIVFALALEIGFVDLFKYSVLFFSYGIINKNYNLISILVLVLFAAPVIEEACKAYGIYVVRKKVREVEDGLVYGASSGFGFAATENFLYEFAAFLSGGFLNLIVEAIVRSLSSALVHGSATAMTGYGYARAKIMRKGSVIQGYFIAVLMHSSFNLIAILPVIYNFGNVYVQLITLVAAIMFGTIAFRVVREKIREYDMAVRASRSLRPA